MKAYEQKITRLLQSRAITGTAVVTAFVAAFYAMWLSPSVGEPVLAQGIFDSLVWQPIADFSLQVIVNAVLLAIAVTALVLINKDFIIIHSQSVLFVAVFVLATAASEVSLYYTMEALTLCLTILAVVAMMYASYQTPRNTRTIYTAFLLLGTGAMWQWSFSLYLPFLLVVCVQMRCMTGRVLLATLMGTVTASWIMWGFSLVSFTDFSWPQLDSVFELIDDVNTLSEYQVSAATVLTVFATFMVMIANMIRIYGSNARIRAFNGVLALLTIATVVGVVVDFGHVEVYTVLLNCFCGVQIGLYFHLYAERRAYIGVVLLMLAYIGLYIWRLWNLL